MSKERSVGKPPTRRYSPEEKAAAVRTLQAELGTDLGTEHGTVYRVVWQLGHGVESARIPCRLDQSGAVVFSQYDRGAP